MFSPAWCHLHSCIMCACPKDACVCVGVLHIFVRVHFVWHVCSVCMSLLCFIWLFILIYPLFIACGYHCLCIGTKMHHVLNISLTSIHLIQLPHPWMQWLRPYQWEILTTQKVGQIKNPPSVCPSSLSVSPLLPPSAWWKTPCFTIVF